MTTSCLQHGDDFFGPQINACERKFDFTLLFEQSILSAAPSALFISFMLLRVAKLSRVGRKTLPNMLRDVKLVNRHPQSPHQVTAKTRTAYYFCIFVSPDCYSIALDNPRSPANSHVCACRCSICRCCSRLGRTVEFGE